MACARSPRDSIRTDSSSKWRLTRSPSAFKSRLVCSASRADDHLPNSTCHSGGASRSPAAYFRMRSSPACHVARSSGEPWCISSSTVRGSVTPASPSAVSRACSASVTAWSSLLRSSSSRRCCCSQSGFRSIHARAASSDSSTICLVRARRRFPNPCRRHSCSMTSDHGMLLPASCIGLCSASERSPSATAAERTICAGRRHISHERSRCGEGAFESSCMQTLSISDCIAANCLATPRSGRSVVQMPLSHDTRHRRDGD